MHLKLPRFFHFSLLWLSLLLQSLVIQPALAENPFSSLGDDDSGISLGGGDDEILEPDQAFALKTWSENGRIFAEWLIADGHYMYRDKTKITAADNSSFTTSNYVIDAGELKHDEFFGDIYVFHHTAKASLAIDNAQDGVKNTSFKVKYQGCSEISGICYPPITKTITLDISPISDLAASTLDSSTNAAPISEQDQIADLLKNSSVWLSLITLFGIGLLLAFTPCVFPMIPILSSIIVGQGTKTSTGRSFSLSVSYVLGMALINSAAGVAAALTGESLAVMLQTPWILASFAGVFVLLSLAMFGFYELQMPGFIQNRLTAVSNNQKSGSLSGAFVMGLLSAVIVGPCVAAPMFGVLLFISQTGDPVFGGIALFSLSLGMGAPLIAIGTSAGKLLPKAGVWMDAVKAVFGVSLLMVAIWMIRSIVSDQVVMILSGTLLIVCAVYMGALDGLKAEATGWTRFWKGTGLVIFIYGIILMFGAAAGSASLLTPLKGVISSNGTHASEQHLQFKKIKGVDGLNKALAEAKAQNKTVMLDFYADWCVSCKEMESLTFTDPKVQSTLSNTVLLQADVTANDEADKSLYKHFKIIGPPAIIFYNTQGDELKPYQVVGYMPAEKFNTHIKQAFNL
ncbi:MAG: thiol:disulfide interchange protein [endosymbiont of Galathealinum brachiosum]|uniref:Thiol:disulfide interchange protein DsbD n=1 Tax=endosymbiont of Galathealinum brachiosum TaxID=2200906 RepID=A0A370D9I7_9GAMM|nr:MAG: thiol:disulfide interchange protein [endosymbiont of Galathealinum brachiosum]